MIDRAAAVDVGGVGEQARGGRHDQGRVFGDRVDLVGVDRGIVDVAEQQISNQRHGVGAGRIEGGNTCEGDRARGAVLVVDVEAVGGVATFEHVEQAVAIASLAGVERPVTAVVGPAVPRSAASVRPSLSLSASR